MRRPRIMEGVERRPLPGDEEVLTSADKATAVILNPVGAAVADLCDGQRTIDEIADVVASCFENIEPEAIRLDVQRIVGELEAAAVVVSD